MKSSARKIQLTSYDDLFKNDEERLADTQERIQMLSPEKMQPFFVAGEKVKEVQPRGKADRGCDRCHYDGGDFE